MKLSWYAQRNFNRGMVELVAIIDRGGPTIDVAQQVNLTMQTQSRNNVIPEPTLQLEGHDAQSLMQALWDIGLRPAENTDRSGEVNALKAHIGFAERVADALVDRLPHMTARRASGAEEG